MTTSIKSNFVNVIDEDFVSKHLTNETYPKKSIVDW